MSRNTANANPINGGNRSRLKHICLALCVIAVAGLVTWQEPLSERSTARESNTDIGDSPTSRNEALVSASSDESPPAPFSLATTLNNTSLNGTQPPSMLVLDPHGKLVVDNRTRDILDYFMSLRGEMDDTDIRALIGQWALEQASPEVADALLAIFERYEDYLHIFSQGSYASQGNGDIRTQMAKRKHQRDQIMGAQLSAALFENDDAYDDFSLKRTDIMRADMSAAEKELSLEQLERDLPQPLAEQYKQQRALKELNQQEEFMRKTGSSAAQIYAMHQDAFGAEAAMRLDKVRQEREQWQKRYDLYAPQRDLIQKAALAYNDQQEQLEALRASLFNETERQRVAALDRLESIAVQ